jgi:hypothetical protein
MTYFRKHSGKEVSSYPKAHKGRDTELEGEILTMRLESLAVASTYRVDQECNNDD